MVSTESLCPVCHVGRLKTCRITLTSRFEENLLVASNTSALVCDVCNETVIDPETLKRLSGLLDMRRTQPWRAPSRRPPAR